MTTSTSRTVTVDRPLAVVADYLCDFTTSVEWDPHTRACKRLDDGPVQVGARYRNTQHLAGRDSDLIYTVVEFQPRRRMVLEGGNDTVRTRDVMTFVETSTGGTEVTYAVEVELLGLAKAGAPLLPSAINKIADQGADSMRSHLNALAVTAD